MNKISETEAAYIAGFFDGEGSIHPDPGGSLRVVISICQKKPEPLLRIQQILGIGRVVQHNSKRWGVSYRYKISSRKQSEDFIHAILPYSIVKKGQLELALEYFKTGVGKGHTLTEDIINKRKWIAQRMREMKR